MWRQLPHRMLSIIENNLLIMLLFKVEIWVLTLNRDNYYFKFGEKHISIEKKKPWGIKIEILKHFLHEERDKCPVPIFPFSKKERHWTLSSPKKQRSSTSYIQLISIRNLILPGEEEEKKTKFEKMNEVSINSLGFGVIFLILLFVYFLQFDLKRRGEFSSLMYRRGGQGRKT